MHVEYVEQVRLCFTDPNGVPFEWLFEDVDRAIAVGRLLLKRLGVVADILPYGSTPRVPEFRRIHAMRCEQRHAFGLPLVPEKDVIARIEGMAIAIEVD